jgi:hypothetical protein
MPLSVYKYHWGYAMTTLDQQSTYYYNTVKSYIYITEPNINFMAQHFQMFLLQWLYKLCPWVSWGLWQKNHFMKFS